MSAARSRRANDKHNHLQRTPILVMGCSLLIACCIAFGGTNWTASAQPSEDQLPEQNAIVEPGYYQETIGSYEAISQSDDDERAENLRLAAEAINGYVIEPGATFSFNEVVGDTTAERGYKEAPVLYSSGLGSSDGGGICQVSTALYIAAVKADLEIVERHPHSVPSDYAPIGLDATIVYGSRDLRIKNNTDFPITIYAKAVGQTVSVNLLGKPRDDGITIDATSRVVDRYEQATKDGGKQQYYVSESFRVYYKDGVRTSRDLLSSDIYAVDKKSTPALVILWAQLLHSISIQSSAPSRASRSTMAQNSSRMLSSSSLPTSYSSTTAASQLLICARLKTTRAMLLQLLRQARQQPNLLRLHSLLHLPLTQMAFLTRMLYSSTSSLARH